MFNLWQRFTGIILLTAVTAVIWIAVDAVTALIIFSLVLLGQTLHHTYCLAMLDRWFQRFDHTSFDAATIPPYLTVLVHGAMYSSALRALSDAIIEAAKI